MEKAKKDRNGIEKGRQNMKKKMLRKVVTGGITLMLLWSSMLPAAADSAEYARIFEQVMERIEQDYTGSVSRQELFEAAMKGMFRSLDEYSEFFNQEQSREFENSIDKEFVGIGIQFQREKNIFVVTRLIAGGSAEEGGVLPGDVLLGADGLSFADITTTEEVANKIMGEKGTFVLLEVKRGAQKLNLRLERRALHLLTAEQIPWSRLSVSLPEKVKPQAALYVALTSFGSDTAAELRAIMEKPENKVAQVLVLDLRDNGGGYVHSVIEIGKMLLPKGKIVSFRDNQGEVEEYYSELNQAPYRKIIALINKNTASAAEILAGAVKDSGIGLLIGERTYGKGVAQEILNINGGEYSFKLTFKDFFTPSGAPVQKVGIAPDILVQTPDYIVSDRRFFPGDENGAIKNAEAILQYLGYFQETPDSKYEANTLPAVLAFQKASGLSPYPVIDFTTQSALNTALRAKLSRKDEALEQAVAECAKFLR